MFKNARGPWWPACAIHGRPPLERQTQRAEGRERAAATQCHPAVPCRQPRCLYYPQPPPRDLLPPSAGPTAAARAGGARGAARFIPGSPPPATPASAANRSPRGRLARSQGRAAQLVHRVLRGSGNVCSSNECRLVGSVAGFPRGPCRPSAHRSSPEPPALSSFRLVLGACGGCWRAMGPSHTLWRLRGSEGPFVWGLAVADVFSRGGLPGPQSAAPVRCEHGIHGSLLSEAQAHQCCRQHRTGGGISEILASWGE